MKTLFFQFTLVLLSMYHVSAQQLSVSPNPSLSSGIETDAEIVSHVSINVPAGTALIWKRVANSIPTGWTSLVCDDVQCWSPTYNGGSSYTTTVGKLDVHFVPNGVQGIGNVTLRVYNPADSAASVIDIVFTSNAMSSSIIDKKENVKLKVFPNPASSIVYVEIEPIADAFRLDIYDIVGSKVKSTDINVTFGYNTMDVSELRSGMYFMRVLNQKGEVLKATSFTKK